MASVNESIIFPLPSQHRRSFIRYSKFHILIGCLFDPEEKTVLYRNKYSGFQQECLAKVPALLWLHYFYCYAQEGQGQSNWGVATAGFRALEIKIEKEQILLKGYQAANVATDGHVCWGGTHPYHLRQAINNFWLSPFTNSMEFAGPSSSDRTDQRFINLIQQYNGEIVKGQWSNLDNIIYSWCSGVTPSIQKINLGKQDGIYLSYSPEEKIIKEIDWAIQDDCSWFKESNNEKINGKIHLQ